MTCLEANRSELGAKPVLPDAEPGFVGGAHTGLLQGQENLAAVMRFVGDEVAEQNKSRAVLDALVALENTGQASLDRAPGSLHRSYEFGPGWGRAGLKAGHAFQEIAPDVRHTDTVHMGEHTGNGASGGRPSGLQQ